MNKAIFKIIQKNTASRHTIYRSWKSRERLLFDVSPMMTDKIETAKMAQEFTSLVNEQKLMINFVDDDNDGQVVATRIELVDNKSTDKFLKTFVSENLTAYELVSDNQILFEFDKKIAQGLTVHLKHKHTISELKTKVTVNYTGLPVVLQPLPIVQEMTWQVDKDEVTKVETYQLISSLKAMTSPVVSGFSAENSEVIVPNLADSKMRPEDLIMTVNYTASFRKITVRLTYNRAQAYTLVTDGKRETSAGGIQSFVATITGQTNEKESQKIHWDIDREQIVTADKVLSLPKVPGYTLSSTEMPFTTTVTLGEIYDYFAQQLAELSISVETDKVLTLTNPIAERKMFIYEANVQKVKINYVDDDDFGEVVFTQTITGKSEAPFNCELDLPSGYDYVSGKEKLPANFDYVDAVDQSVAIHVKHKHIKRKFETSYIVTYNGLPADKQLQAKVQTVIWEMNTDEITGQTIYQPVTQLANVLSPIVKGYSAESLNLVAATLTPLEMIPEDVTVIVTYIGNPQKVVVNLVDDDSNGVIVDSYVLTGQTDEVPEYDDTFPLGYEGVTDISTLPHFDDDAVNQIVTVHLKHKRTYETLETKATVNYIGLAATRSLSPNSQKLTWTAETDLVTGLTTYKPETALTNVITPVIKGYTADNACVTMPKLPEMTTKPDELTTIVAYTANTQKVIVNVVDDDNNGEVIHSYDIIGKTDESFTYHDCLFLGYLNNTDFTTLPTVFDDADDLDQIVTIHVKHRHTQGRLETKAVVNYTGLSDDKRQASNVQTIIWDTDTDQVSGVTIYSPTSVLHEVNTPFVADYTANIEMVAAVSLVETTVKPKDTETTVNYSLSSYEIHFYDETTDEMLDVIDLVATELEVTLADYQAKGYVIKTNEFADHLSNVNNVGYSIYLAHDTKRLTETKVAHFPVYILGKGGTEPKKIVLTTTLAREYSLDLVTGNEISATDLAAYDTASAVHYYSDNPQVVIDSTTGIISFDVAVDGDLTSITFDGELPTFDNIETNVMIEYLPAKVTARLIYYRYQLYVDSHEPYQPYATDIQTFTVVIKGYRDVNDAMEINWEINRSQELTADKTYPLPSRDGYTLSKLDKSRFNRPSDEMPFDETIDLGTVFDALFEQLVTLPLDTKHINVVTGFDDYEADKSRIFYYEASPQEVFFNFVDDETGSIVKIDVKVGVSDGDAYDYNLTAPAGYSFVYDGYEIDAETGEKSRTDMPVGYNTQDLSESVATFSAKANVSQTTVIHLKHQHSQGTFETHFTINYHYGGNDKLEPTVQVITFETDIDDVTGVVTYMPTMPTVEVNSPVFGGYTADQKTVLLTLSETMTMPENQEVDVYYTANEQKYIINYVDDDCQGNLLKTETIVGKSDEIYPFEVEAIPNYDFVGHDDKEPLVFDHDDWVNQVRTLHLVHVHTQGMVGSLVTINYTGLPIDKKLVATTQTISWETDRDEVTGKTTYQPVKVSEDILSPIVKGYTAEKARISFDDLPELTSEPEDLVVTVNYTGKLKKVIVNTLDADNKNQVIDTYTITGRTDELFVYPKNDLSGYDYTTDFKQLPYRFADDESVEQIVSVYVRHHHTQGSFETNAIIKYVGLPEYYLEAGPNIQRVMWQTDTDEVTNITVYTPVNQTKAVVSPKVDGYIVDQATVSAITFSETRSQPKDTVVLVTYTVKVEEAYEFEVTLVYTRNQYYLSEQSNDTVDTESAEYKKWQKGLAPKATQNFQVTLYGKRESADSELIMWSVDRDQVLIADKPLLIPEIKGYTLKDDAKTAFSNTITVGEVYDYYQKQVVALSQDTPFAQEKSRTICEIDDIWLTDAQYLEDERNRVFVYNASPEIAVQVEEITATITYKRYQVYKDSRLSLQAQYGLTKDENFRVDEQIFIARITGTLDNFDSTEINWHVNRDLLIKANQPFPVAPVINGYALMTNEEQTTWDESIDLGTIFDAILGMKTTISKDGRHIDFEDYGYEGVQNDNTKYFFYAPRDQKYDISYLDETGTIVKTQTEIGKSNTSQTILLDLPEGYERVVDKQADNKQADNGDIVLNLWFDEDDYTDQTRTVQVKKKVVDLPKVTILDVTVPKKKAEVDKSEQLLKVTFIDKTMGQTLEVLSLTQEQLAIELAAYETRYFVHKSSDEKTPHLADTDETIQLVHRTKRVVEEKEAEFVVHLAFAGRQPDEKIVLKAQLICNYSIDLVTGQEVQTTDMANYDDAELRTFSSTNAQVVIDKATGLICFDLVINGKNATITVPDDAASFDSPTAKVTVEVPEDEKQMAQDTEKENTAIEKSA
ncbi:hypothetical protein Hs30E_16960 [Lactococcus hodotermopsidis]|uniref:Gram-positive cocci surface proteins LPxTG domain-containing protein n=1 Tax=Pseudolactococcus hodotermopsidis TaxID=2709157 RepID=A0A6A0BEM2_9LACT|nr:hypothetical protein [Lactococcus hodotermopsidis]GFH43145.1 hypothetical protein Hs30E_16960 [Lactococcus hodotermopsidis]